MISRTEMFVYVAEMLATGVVVGFLHAFAGFSKFAWKCSVVRDVVAEEIEAAGRPRIASVVRQLNYGHPLEAICAAVLGYGIVRLNLHAVAVSGAFFVCFALAQAISVGADRLGAKLMIQSPVRVIDPDSLPKIDDKE